VERRENAAALDGNLVRQHGLVARLAHQPPVAARLLGDDHVDVARLDPGRCLNAARDLPDKVFLGLDRASFERLDFDVVCSVVSRLDVALRGNKLTKRLERLVRTVRSELESARRVLEPGGMRRTPTPRRK